MKYFCLIFIILFSMMFFNTSHSATKKQKAYVHKVVLGDVGEIKSVANTKANAFKQSASTCFERRLALYEKHRGAASENTQLEIIDHCANIKW